MFSKIILLKNNLKIFRIMTIKIIKIKIIIIVMYKFSILNDLENLLKKKINFM